MDQQVPARRRRPVAPAGGPVRGSGGFSMLEALVAIAIAGLLLVGIISGFFTTISASSRSERRSRSESVLASLTERAQLLPYVPCASLTAMRSAVGGLDRPSHYVVDVESVTYLNPPPADPPDAGPRLQTFGSTCSTDQGAQLVTLSVRRDVAGAVAVRGQVVVRNPQAGR